MTSGTERNGGAEPPSPPRTGWRTRITRTHAAIALAGSALIGTFTILEGVFNVFPGLKPDEPCAREHAVDLTDVVLDRSVTREESLVLQRASTKNVPAERLAQPGKLVSVSVWAKGYEGDSLDLRTWVLTERGAPLPNPELRDQLAHRVTLEGCEEGVDLQLWSPTPHLEGQYRIRLELVAPDGRTVLDREETVPFTVGAPQ